MDLSVRIGKKTMPSPVGVASGTFGYGGEYADITDFSAIGAIYTKAVTLQPREGNAVPRLKETPSGLLNSIGLANVGVKRFISEKWAFLSQLPCAVIPNIAGSTPEEYGEVLRILEQDTDVFGYEINISCPNVSHGGLAFGTDPDMVRSLSASLRSLTDKPLIVKLTPNVTDITAIAIAAQEGGADAVSCINTLVGMVIDTTTGKPVLPAGTGGLSGPAIRPVGVALTYRVARAVSIPVIGVGGIMSGDDALQYLLAGACAIQVGTGNFIDPAIHRPILDRIGAYCTQKKIKRICDIHHLQ
jgi:dihydroorotate dehydrogenase (NAD+) catalytic subunit